MSVTYKGRTYPTIAALAIAYGLTADACASHLRRDRPLEEPLRTVLPVSYAGWELVKKAASRRRPDGDET